MDEGITQTEGYNLKIKKMFPKTEPNTDAMRILLMDLSQFFSKDGYQLNDLVEQPLGLMYLMSYLNRELGSKIHGKIANPVSTSTVLTR